MRHVLLATLMTGSVLAIGCGCFSPLAPTDSTTPSSSPPSVSPVPTPPGTPVSLQVLGKTALRIGESGPVVAMATYGDGQVVDVTRESRWTNSSNTTCSLSSEEVLTGLAAGDCVIGAEFSTATARLTVTVISNEAPPPQPPNPPSVVLLALQGTNLLRIGESAPWQAVATLSDGTQQTVTSSTVWASGSTDKATVSATGVVTGVAEGAAQIQGTYAGRTASAPVTIVPGQGVVLTSLSIEGNTSIQAGQSTQLVATAHWSNGTETTVTSAAAWASASPSVASVNGGLVTGLVAGTAAISASYGGKIAQTVVQVSASKQLVGIEVTADSDLNQVQLDQLLRLHVYGVYSDGSRAEVTAAAVISCDDPLLRVDGPGLVNVLLTMVSALTNPTHVINVQYGGFTAQARITIKLPVLQQLQLGDGLSLRVGSQLPAVQAIFGQGKQATLDATFSGLTWSLQARGGLGAALQLLGVSLNQVLVVSNGTITVVNQGVLGQLLTLVGGVVPVNLQATFQGVISNVSASTVAP